MKTDEDHISNSAHVKVARVPQKAKRQDFALAQQSLLEHVIDAAISFARHRNSRRDRLAGCFLPATNWLIYVVDHTSLYDVEYFIVLWESLCASQSVHVVSSSAGGRSLKRKLPISQRTNCLYFCVLVVVLW